MNFLASKKQLRASFLRWSLFTVPLIVLLGFMSGQLGSPDTAWFAGLNKPSLFPPPYLFGIVWTVLYIMIGLSLALVASAWGAAGRGFALVLFALHFLGNLAWTPVFFGMQDMQTAFWVLTYVVVSLLLVIVVFWRVRRMGGVLLLPYLGWVIFASVLNWQFIDANPDGGERGSEGATQRVTL